MRGFRTIAAAAALTAACSGSPELSKELAPLDPGQRATTTTEELVSQPQNYQDVVLDLRQELVLNLSSLSPLVHSNMGNCALIGNENAEGNVEYSVVGHPLLTFEEIEMVEADAVLSHAGINEDRTLLFGATVLVNYDAAGNVVEVDETTMPGESRGLNLSPTGGTNVQDIRLKRNTDGTFSDNYGNTIGVVIKKWENTIGEPEGFSLAAIEACIEYMDANYDPKDYDETSTLDA